MIVVCPQCETRFNIPEDKYRPGRKARCSNCGNIFPLPEIAAPESGIQERPVTDDEPSPPPGGMEENLPEESPAPPAGEKAKQALPDDAAGPEAPVPPPPVSVEDAVLDPDAEKTAKKAGGKIGRKRLLGIGAGIALLLLVGGGFLLYPLFRPPAPPMVPAERVGPQTSLALDGRGGEQGEDADAARQAAVRRLVLEKVRQYTVTENPKTGRMVVVEGTVVNNFDAPKDLILLEIRIFDEKGTPLVLREQYAGVTLSYIQLTTMPKAALENALNNQANILTNNTDIPPGGRVSFMTVFFDLPGSAHEFEVKIVDVKDPAAK